MQIVLYWDNKPNVMYLTRILLLGREFHHKGGVTNYVRLLKENLSSVYDIKHFVQGLKPKYHIDYILPIVYISQLLKFKKVLKEYEPDLVHLNPSMTWVALIRDLAFLKIVKNHGFPVLFFIHGWHIDLNKKNKQNIFLKFFLKKNFEKADGIVVLAKRFKEELVNSGIKKEKIYVSSPMVNSKDYQPGNKRFERPFKVLFCSNMKKEKGPYELLDAISIVLDKYPDTNFIFIGEGKELEKLKNLSKEKHIEKNVEFRGYLTGSDKFRAFGEAHIFILPSYSEGFPTVVLEAMASGLPLVVTPVGRLDEIIEEGMQGLIINSVPPNPKEISEKIIQLIENPKLMKKISNNNLERAKVEYDVNVISSQITKIYENILRK